MPLFVAKIKVTVVVDIPVFGIDKEAAETYLLTNKEWLDDAALCDVLRTADDGNTPYISGTEVCLIENAAECPFDHDVLAWGEYEERDVVELLYESELKPLEDIAMKQAEDDDINIAEAAFDAFNAKRKSLRELYISEHQKRKEQ